MRKIYIEKDVLKKFLCKKLVQDNIVTKRILGVSLGYVHGSVYEQFISILKYIEPYLEQSIEEVVTDFKNKISQKYVSSDIYAKDLVKYQDIINNFDPSVLKPSEGEIREIQLKELEFAKKIIDDIEQNTDIHPFMDDGTLLGAVRHKGFIPWDDDIDFSLMREDFEQLEKYFQSKYIQIDISKWHLAAKSFDEELRKTFEKYPNQIFFLRRNTSMKVFQGVADNYCFCDFFPLDYYDEFLNVEMLQKYADKVRDAVSDVKKTFAEVMELQKQERLNNNLVKQESNNIQVGIDNFDFIFYTMKGMRRKSDIFPLRKMKFEYTEFWAPNNCHEYLKTLFNNYNKIPSNVKIASHQQVDNSPECLILKRTKTRETVERE